MRGSALALALVCACAPRTPPRNVKPVEAGLSLALYADGDERYGVVDDRRWVEVAGTTLLFGNIDPGAALASLVIEPIDTGGGARGAALKIGPCSRDRLPELSPDRRDGLAQFAAEQERIAAEGLRRRVSRTLPNVAEPVRPPRDTGPRYAPIVRCDVTGAPGRHLVRIVYVSTALGYRAQHDIDVREPSRATIESRYAIATPPWRERAEAVIFDGIPGGDRVPRELVRGPITLDGGTSVLVVPAREVAAHVRRIYAGTVVHDGAGDNDTDDVDDNQLWEQDPLDAVWAMLEAPGVELSAGPVRVTIDLPTEPQRFIDVPASARRRLRDSTGPLGRPLRLPLWIDDTLRGTRQRNVVDNDGVRLVESFAFTITNLGDTPRQVWVEERARRASRRTVERPWPKKPTVSGDVLRNVLDVGPGRVQRAGYLVVYDQ